MQDKISDISIIEDNFIVGFKLRLIQMLYFSSVIFSRVDLNDEIMALGLSTNYFHHVKEIQDIKFNDIDLYRDYDSLKTNRLIITQNFDWGSIASKFSDFFLK